MFFRDLFTFLWTLLFIIPGIIKSYEYKMVPYLLAEYPDMDRKEVFARSRDMMYGQKWNTFVLDLSFIPWNILSTITFGLVGLFYVSPYQDATYAELYDTLATGMPGNNKALNRRGGNELPPFLIYFIISSSSPGLTEPSLSTFTNMPSLGMTQSPAALRMAQS